MERTIEIPTGVLAQQTGISAVAGVVSMSFLEQHETTMDLQIPV